MSCVTDQVSGVSRAAVLVESMGTARAIAVGGIDEVLRMRPHLSRIILVTERNVMPLACHPAIAGKV